MPAQILTTDDLHAFKDDLLHEIQKMFRQNGVQPVKKWMKSKEVRKLLNISPGTLQSLRVNGSLPYTRMGGVIYYDYEEIQKALQSHKR